jgi:hypothetical protein
MDAISRHSRQKESDIPFSDFGYLTPTTAILIIRSFLSHRTNLLAALLILMHLYYPFSFLMSLSSSHTLSM